MAELNFLFGKQDFRTQVGYQDDQNNLFGVLQLDATIRETHKLTSQITSHEIEKAADGTNKINDNVILDPESLQIEGMISEAPLSLIAALQNVTGGIVANQNVFAGAAVNYLSSQVLASVEDRQQNALVQLTNFWKNGRPFTIVTGLKRYEDMMITSITMPIDTKLGKSLKFTIDCIKVKIVSSKVVSIPITSVSKDVDHTATSKQSLGKQRSTVASEKETERGASILSRLTGLGA